MAIRPKQSAKEPKKSSKSQSGASTHSLKVSDKLRAYFGHHRKVGVKTLEDLCASFMTSLMTWMVIGIALALPTILFILLDNTANLGADWEGKPRLSLYLKASTTMQQGTSLAAKLGRDGKFKHVNYISSAAALDDFKESAGKSAGISEVLASLPTNPLPAVIEIEPLELEPAQIRLKVAQLQALPEVDSVSVDLEWIERLLALVSLAERFVIALGCFLGLGVLLAIGNTIRLAIENRRAEIEVVKLVGGTDRFVRRPFLYLGFWYGTGGAIVAWVMVQASWVFLSGPLEKLLYSYQEVFVMQGLSMFASAVLFLCGGALGVIGATLAVSRHLHQIEPS